MACANESGRQREVAEGTISSDLLTSSFGFLRSSRLFFALDRLGSDL